MSNLWTRDDRITENYIRDLEKKVHFLMAVVVGQGLVTTNGGNYIDLPDDINADGREVMGQIPANI